MESMAQKALGEAGASRAGTAARLGRWLYLAVRLGLSLVFVYAGAVKLMDPGGFAEIIVRYDMLPMALVPYAAIGLPALEVVTGLGLALDARLCLGAVTAMLLMFAVVLWFGVLKGLEIDCGCFSADELAEHDSLRQALHRDLFMLAGAAYLYIWRWFNRRALVRRGWRLSWNNA